MSDYRFYIAEFVVRLFLGIIIFFQGYDKVFKIGVSRVIHTFELDLVNKHNVPRSILTFAAFFTSYVELICGFLLIIGLFRYAALAFIGLDILIVSLAFSMIKPMWELKFVFPRVVLMGALLIFPQEWGILSIDNLIQLLKK
jgi:putative oxidoreductase